MVSISASSPADSNVMRGFSYGLAIVISAHGSQWVDAHRVDWASAQKMIAERTSQRRSGGQVRSDRCALTERLRTFSTCPAASIRQPLRAPTVADISIFLGAISGCLLVIFRQRRNGSG